ncbi:MAG: DUF992 domain-containing protein [Chromatiales bacterium]|nr:DUF992 domain-containing protein [Chromatiales bacterium]
MKNRTQPRRRIVVPLIMAATALAMATTTNADTQLGGMVCDRIEGSGINLLITSSAEVRCVFSGEAGSRQWYQGETGVGFGLDLKWTKAQRIHYLIISSTRQFVPEGEFLQGNFGGATAQAAAGIGIGASVLIGGSDETTSLQPALSTSQGAGFTAGISYLQLESDPLNQARIATPYGQRLTQALYAGYFDAAFRQYHATPRDYEGSDHFSRKAIEAASGVVPLPDQPSVWGRASDSRVSGIRKRLMAAMRDTGGADVEAARAQVAFDCWLYGLAKAAGGAGAAACHSDMLDAIDKVEIAAAEARATESIMRESTHLVLFETDSYRMNRHARVELASILERLSKLSEARVWVVGNTDRVGSKAYNDTLSEQRAASVLEGLLNAGIPVEWLGAEARGESNPISISSNPHDALNRRVDVTIEPITAKASAVKRAVRKLKPSK